DDNVILTVNITDEHNNPLNVTVNGVLNGRDLDSLETTNGLANFTISRSSGFYYFYCYYRGNTVYNSSQSNINELIFANDNTMVDLAVRIVCSDGVLNLTKDYVGYGSNSVTRRNVSDYDQILLQYSEINGGIPVNKNLLINGNGHKIDASAEMYLTRGFFIFMDVH
ncbi:MAG: Ig-like domain repeat protein, partial [Methanobrevibacter sp.]|nr:Ig-like domain repeat protein [Methanobrevibacter sp.]